MKTRCQNTYHIVGGVGKQETSLGWKKCITELATSLEKHSDGSQAQGDLPGSSSRITRTKKKEKDKRKNGTERIIRKWFSLYLCL